MRSKGKLMITGTEIERRVDGITGKVWKNRGCVGERVS